MTGQTRHFLNKLLLDLRKNPDVPAHHAIQAVILGSIKLKLDTGEVKEVLDILRMEYGMDRQRWSETVVLLLKSIPTEYREQGRIIIT